MAEFSSESVSVYVLRNDKTIEFAAGEMKKYLEMMQTGTNVTVQQQDGHHHAPNGIRLGLYEDFDLITPDLADPRFDDSIHIDVSKSAGVIAGSNARSVLLGVYRFLEETGCRWVRPGSDGEYIPQRSIQDISVHVDDVPSHRYRGCCIEGAVSFENMIENIDWMPKVGFNSYFLEFMTPYTFFERWYSHRHNKYKEPEDLTVEMVAAFKKDMEQEITKRGLIYHAVGHGWTCEPFGVPGLGWDPEELEIDEKITQYLAEIDGKREIYGGVPLNTNLCYSNPKAREAVVDYAVEYVKANSHIDVLHIWMADNFNNHCECVNCRDTLPSDFLIVLINELDAAFTEHGIDTKIAFIAYLDLMWAPRKEKLNNPDRFVLLFAPISRTYSHSYDLDTSGVNLSEYQRNKVQMPTDIRENLAYLEEWQKFFDGDAFTYEYYFMWDHYFDPGYYETAKILNEDIKKLKRVGLNGLISDQTQRSFFPTGFGMYVMAKTLWDETADFDDLAKAYFNAAFGPDGDLCREYMAALSRLFDPPYVRDDIAVWSGKSAASATNTAAAERLDKIPGLIADFRSVIQRNAQVDDSCQARSWQYLLHHADVAELLSRALKARAQGHMEEASELWYQVEDMVQKNEDTLQPVLDVFEFVETLGRKFVEPRAHVL
jgi:hypothetical protein